MAQQTLSPTSRELDDFVHDYETALARGVPTDWKAFLPTPDDPLYRKVQRELVRVDLEYAWENGRPKRLEEYRRLLPDLFQDPEGLGEIAFEEYRLRQQAGENPAALEYQQRFGITTANWDAPGRPSAPPPEDAVKSVVKVPDNAAPPEGLPQDALLREAALAYQEMRERQVDEGKQELSWLHYTGSTEHARVFDDLHRADPRAADCLAQAMTCMPKVGSAFLGFRLRAELGRGAFCRVYLAQQGDLANRLVVLKVGAYLVGESQTLAQLQHTHIVPIYSFHRADPHQAVCMPYFGATTLGQVLADLQARPTLPASGKELVHILEARRDARLAQLAKAVTVAAAPAAPPSPAEPLRIESAIAARDTLKTLEELSYVDAVLWIAARLAEGLTHAHERGILHRDLKPANVLLTDDGQPMLSDFNLSEDTKLLTSVSAARIGGTLAYMAPEHVEAFQDGVRPVDARSDLYSFGIILYELLTGRHPFALPRGPLQKVLAQIRADRLQAPPLVRCWNRAVSAAVETIVRRCLDPEPGRRYQTARQLREDLQRQLDSLPLKHTPEPSLSERLHKWRRRHRRLASTTTVGTIVMFLLLGLMGLYEVRDRQVTRLRAVASLRQLRDDLKTIHSLVNAPEMEPQQWEEGLAQGRRILERYHVLDTPHWQETASVRALSAEETRGLRDDVGELLLLLAGATARQAKMNRESTTRQERLEQALRLNALAESCYPPDGSPRALWQQRADLTRLSGRTEEAAQLLEKAKAIPLRSARDRFLLIAYHVEESRLREALAFLREACRHEPNNFAWWLVLGNCQAGLGEARDAADSYDHGIALWPEGYWAYFNRGVLFLEQLKDYRHACEDFDDFLRLRPDVPQGYYNRALAKYYLGDWAGAEADLTHLIERAYPSLRAYFLRAKVRDKAGNLAGAQQDRNEGLRREPADDKDWIARGVVRQKREPEGALADYRKALQLNPRSRMALLNQAHVLAEHLGRTAEAVHALNELVSLYPDYVHARASRGVYLARLGQRNAALADAQECLLRDSRPPTRYQVAGIYALSARQHGDDRREAFRLLSSALGDPGWGQRGLELLDKDSDLDPIRNDPEFGRLVEAARVLRTAGRPPPNN